MRAQDLGFVPAVEQARLVRAKEVSPVELVELYLERIERLNPKLDAYLTVVGDMALEDARRAEAEVGADDLPPFHGVPISIKDLNDTAGIRTTHGSKSWADRVPERDDHVVTRLKRAGFIILGKTNTPEFGKSVVTEPEGYPPCRNPWNTDRSPGGSSGGAASALAAGLCAISQGSDGGGSIRMPAACCGVFGIKPSRGRVSSAPNPPALFSHPGPIARTVQDAAAMLDVLAGYETGDLFWAAPPERPFSEEVGRPTQKLRIAYTYEPAVENLEVHPGHRAGVEETAKLLESLGHDVEQAKPDWGNELVDRSMLLKASSLAARAGNPEIDDLDFVNQAMFRLAHNSTAVHYTSTLRDIQLWTRPVVEFFDTYDVLMTPTTGIQPPLIGEFADLAKSVERVMKFRAMSMYTSVFNKTGQPAVSIPLAWDEDELPVGIHLVGRPADEALLIRLSAQLEEAHPWADRRPPVS